MQLMMTNCPDRRPTVKQLLSLPAIKKAFAKRHREMVCKEAVQYVKSFFAPFISSLMSAWTFIFWLPYMSIKNMLSCRFLKEKDDVTPPSNNKVIEQPWSGELMEEEEYFNHAFRGHSIIACRVQ